MKALRPSTLSLALGMAFAALGAQAQQAPPVPNIGDALRQVQPPVLPAPKAAPLPTVGGTAIEPPMLALPGSGPGVRVDSFAIVGNSVVDSAVLLALVQPDQGKTLSLAELELIATRITRYYRSAGYFVARAYIPAQEVAAGTLTIRVVEGNYGRFILANRSRVRDDIVQGLLDDIKDRDIVSLDTLERAMLVINDTPGVTVVRADVMPGEAVGTSDFAIGTEATPAYGGYALLDNYGSAYTGKQRLSFNADWNSPSGRGDRLSVSGMATRHSGLLNGRLGYSGLLDTDGTRGELALSRTRYQLGSTYAALDASGTADALEFNLTRPVKRTRGASIEAGLSLAYKSLKDEVASTSTRTRKKAATASASVSARNEQVLFGFDGLTQASAALTIGRLRFDDATAAALDAAGAGTQGSFAKLNLQVTRATALPGQFALTTSARAQLALNDKNLDGSERMSVSGFSGVIAYPSGELSGDHAALLHLDLAHPLPPAGTLQMSASAFADIGWARTANPLPGAASRSLSDVGVGLTANAAGGLVRLQLAQRVSGGAPTSEPASRLRVLLQGGWVF
ncbi:ShlB/FhaC/HecB family hemolysin secretion/activation protein [Rubrivivax gelatinosus]|uniref:ShlB/FhaC/HecB family hemolysin secretion/activation protein n=1 Tax=Rubrivivax gelatinosus TaxID=28068 RepID=UPI001902EE0B